MSIYKMVQKEREDFYDDSWTRGLWSFIEDVYGSTWNFHSSVLPSIHRLKDILPKEELVKARDKGEIIDHWLENNEYHDLHPRKPLVTLDDARKSVMRIDDGRIGSDTWYPKESNHPVWHTSIGK